MGAVGINTNMLQYKYKIKAYFFNYLSNSYKKLK